jgi:hypothetical protein
VCGLQGDPRTKTLQEQLDDFSDPTVTGLNLITSRNQMELLLAKNYWVMAVFTLISCWVIIILYDAAQTLTSLHGGSGSGSATEYTVQLSANASIWGATWRNVVCKDEQYSSKWGDSGGEVSRQPCVFQNIPATSVSKPVVGMVSSCCSVLKRELVRSLRAEGVSSI